MTGCAKGRVISDGKEAEAIRARTGEVKGRTRTNVLRKHENEFLKQFLVEMGDHFILHQL